MQWIALVAALTVGSASTLENPNVKTIQDQCAMSHKLAGQTVNEAMMEKLMPQMEWFYAPMIDCSQVATSEEFGYSLKGVPVTACYAENAKKYAGMQIIDMWCEDIAADESGKSVMVYQPSVFKMTTGQTVSLPLFMKYDFNDDGKIVSYISQFDTSALDVATAAAKNMATIKSQCTIFQEMEGQTISDTLLASLVPQLMMFYAPVIDCNQVATSQEFGFQLQGVPVGECFSGASRKYSGLQVIGNKCEDIAADKHGKSVMLYEIMTFKMTTGKFISVPMFIKYDFNDDGKIFAYSAQFDTSVLENSRLHEPQPWNPQGRGFESDTPAAKNSATIMYTCKMYQEMVQGQMLDKALMQKLFQGMMGFFAPTVDCEQVGTSAQFGFRLQGVPVSECFGEASKKYGGVQVLDAKCEDIAADKSGKSVMVYQASVFRLATGQMVSMPIMSKYDFNDDGKIVAYSSQFDTSVLEASNSLRPQYQEAPQQYSVGFPAAAMRNMETMKVGCEMFSEMASGQTVNEALMEKLVAKMMGFYAPTVNCDQVATNKEFGFSLHNVPVAACFGEGTKKYGGMQIVRMRCGDVAADKSGKSVMTYATSTFKMTTGQTVNVPMLSKYDFNDEGKIVAYSTQFDTSVLGSPQSGYYGSQFTTPFMPAAVKNLATVRQLCGIFQEMMGQPVSESLMEKLMPEMEGLFEPTIHCDQVATSTEFGFSLEGVPFSSCFGEAAAKFGGTQFVDMGCEDITADQSGKIVVNFAPVTLLTTSGQNIMLPIVTKYDFNDGKIISYSSQFDTSIFAPAPFALAQDAFTKEWAQLALALTFALGCSVAFFVMRVVTKAQPSLPQEGYEPCA